MRPKLLQDYVRGIYSDLSVPHDVPDGNVTDLVAEIPQDLTPVKREVYLRMELYPVYRLRGVLYTWVIMVLC